MLLSQKSGLAFVLVAATALAALPLLVRADDKAAPRTVSVSGYAELKLNPDKADIMVNIQEQAAQLADVKHRTDEQLKALRAIAKEQGVKDEDLQTVNSSTQPVYRWDQNGKRIFEGYNVTHQIRVTTRTVDAVGVLVDKFLSAGIDQIDGVTYGMENDESVKAKVLALAVTNAKQKAEGVADAADETLGAVISIQEGGVNYAPQPMPMMMAKAAMMADGAMAAPEAAPTPPAGQIVVSANASAVFALKD